MFNRGKQINEREVTPEILGVLRSMDLFKGKDPDELTEWLGMAPFEGGAECALREFAPGERIITEGSFGNSFFILTRGSVNASFWGRKLCAWRRSERAASSAR